MISSWEIILVLTVMLVFAWAFGAALMRWPGIGEVVLVGFVGLFILLPLALFGLAVAYDIGRVAVLAF